MVFAFRSLREWRATLFLADALRDAPAELPTMTVVIPAHNEERVAAACARSVLASDYPGLDVVFVLDRCTDGTRAALPSTASSTTSRPSPPSRPKRFLPM